jgi:hypothetical protein
MEEHISAGWTVRDSASIDAGDGEQLVYALQRRPGGPDQADLDNDLVIDLQDTLIVVNAFGSTGQSDTFKHVALLPSSYGSAAALLAAWDSTAETEIAAGWNAIDSDRAMIDGDETLLLSFQLRNLPKSADLDSNGFIDLHDALLSLALFNTPVQPTPPQPVPPGPDRHRQIIYDPADFPSASAWLAAIDKDQEVEIIEAYDPMDSSAHELDGTPSLVYSSMRSLRQHRADLFDDDIIDLRDALEALAHFGEPQPSIFKQLQIDPSSASSAEDLILATDPVMEGQIALGFDVHDSELVELDGDNRVLWSLRLEEIPVSYDLDGDQFTDLRDALVALSMFGQLP